MLFCDGHFSLFILLTFYGPNQSGPYKATDTHTHTHTSNWAFCVIGSSPSFASQGTGRHRPPVNMIQDTGYGCLDRFKTSVCSHTYTHTHTHTFHSFTLHVLMPCKHIDSQKNTMSLHYVQGVSLTGEVAVSAPSDGLQEKFLRLLLQPRSFYWCAAGDMKL